MKDMILYIEYDTYSNLVDFSSMTIYLETIECLKELATFNNLIIILTFEEKEICRFRYDKEQKDFLKI